MQDHLSDRRNAISEGANERAHHAIKKDWNRNHAAEHGHEAHSGSSHEYCNKNRRQSSSSSAKPKSKRAHGNHAFIRGSHHVYCLENTVEIQERSDQAVQETQRQ